MNQHIWSFLDDYGINYTVHQLEGGRKLLLLSKVYLLKTAKSGDVMLPALISPQATGHTDRQVWLNLCQTLQGRQLFRTESELPPAMEARIEAAQVALLAGYIVVKVPELLNFASGVRVGKLLFAKPKPKKK